MYNQSGHMSDRVRFRKLDASDLQLLKELATITFVQSHGHSAPAKDIETYLNSALDEKSILKELADEESLFYFIELDGTPVGYSKIVLNAPFENADSNAFTKLERIYLLEAHHGQKLGLGLLEFNIELAKEAGQLGIWLFTWVENHKAIDFYLRFGFEINGEHDFRISPTHVNPNHQMLLTW
jgi:GNAT superfamily N-acetyltransferase